MTLNDENLSLNKRWIKKTLQQKFKIKNEFCHIKWVSGGLYSWKYETVDARTQSIKQQIQHW